MSTRILNPSSPTNTGSGVDFKGVLKTLSVPLIGPILVIVLWGLAAQLNWVSDKLLPGPVATFGSLFESLWSGSMVRDALATLHLTASALGIAVAFGLPVGIVLGSNRSLYRSFEFVIDFFRSTPATAMFPLFLLIFGIADSSKISVAAFAAWLVFVFNVAYGVMNARQTRILAAKVMGASRGRIFFDVMFFESLTQTFVGARMAVSIALVVIIVAEMFIGSINGMGHRIIDAQQVYDLEGMYASILVTGVIGYGLNLIFLGLERWLVHWAGR